MRGSLLCSILLLAGSATNPSPATHVELNIYAAASLRDVLQKLAPEWELAAGVRLVFNFGASSDLARQIEAANKADLFISADEEWMDRLEGAGLVDHGSRRSLLSNRLVVIAASDATFVVRGASDLAGPAVKRLSLANPEAVPAGKYARAWLERKELWKAVRERVVPAVDVRAALAVVESGLAEAGIVYRTDATVSRSVRVVYEVPESEGPRISYPLACMKDRPRLEIARRAASWLSGSEAAAVFERYGFIVNESKR